MKTIKLTIAILLVTLGMNAQTGKLVMTYKDSNYHELFLSSYVKLEKWVESDSLSVSKKRLGEDLIRFCETYDDYHGGYLKVYSTESGDLEFFFKDEEIKLSDAKKGHIINQKTLEQKSALAITYKMYSYVFHSLEKYDEESLLKYYSNLDAIAQSLIEQGKSQTSRSSGQSFYNAIQEAYRRGLIKPLVDGIYDYNTYVPKVKTAKKK
jgi:hypothetical protein